MRYTRAVRAIRLPGLSVVFEDGQRVLVRAPARGIGVRVPPMAVGVLAWADRPRTAEEAAAAFGPPGAALFRGLCDAGVLVSPEQAATTPAFFDNFASLDVHRRMLADHTRVEAYRAALDELVEPGMVVADAGTGSGVLAVLAARAGARRVYAIDNSEMVVQAREVVRRSGLADAVQVIRSDFAQVRLPERCDLVVTETFGALALAEGAAADLTAFCAANLAADGVVVPGRIHLWVAPVGAREPHAEILDPFVVDGVDLSCLAEQAVHRGVTLPIQEEALAGPAVRFADVRFPERAVEARGAVHLEASRPARGLAAWFDLCLSPSTTLSTRPSAPETHWHQVYLPFAEPVAGPLALELPLRPAPDDRRGLVVEATAGTGAWRWRVR